MQGRIIKCVSNDYSVLTNDGVFICKPCGKFRYLKIKPLVGDMVVIDEKQHYINEILPRKNSLLRPPVSNIDQAIIITSVKSPDFSTNLLDKLIAIIEYNKIKPIICFTKLDLINDNNEILKYIEYYKKIGYQVFINTELDKIKKIFKDKVSIFTGQSGAGKSTLLNNLDNDLNLKTSEISVALNRGKHTTRHVELLKILSGFVADTPGFSSIDFNNMSKDDIKDGFIEFKKYENDCQYKDCIHNLEPNCAVKDHVGNDILESRYKNYLKFIGGD